MSGKIKHTQNDIKQERQTIILQAKYKEKQNFLFLFFFSSDIFWSNVKREQARKVMEFD